MASAPKPKATQLNVRLSQDLVARVRQTAEQRDTSVSRVVRRALEREVAK